MVILLNDETEGMKERMKQCIKGKKGKALEYETQTGPRTKRSERTWRKYAIPTLIASFRKEEEGRCN